MPVSVADTRRASSRSKAGGGGGGDGEGARLSRGERARLAKIASAVMAAEGCCPDAELSIAIGDDRWIQELNERYTGKSAPTDVLAFPQDAATGEGGLLLGDVAVSAETAERQAEEMGHGLMAELAVLVIHGILHLTGWEDGTAVQRRRMMGRAMALLAESAPDLGGDLGGTGRGRAPRPRRRGRGR